MKVIYLKKDAIYVNKDGRIVKKEFSYEKGVVTASIGYNHILNITFKLPKTIEKDMLEVEAEQYIFTEGSLDYSKEYKINYFFKEYDEYINVEAFVVATDILKTEYEKYLKVYKYIDFISAKPFVFKSYYDITNTAPKNDVFIYFDEDEAFLSCFENGEFVFVKSITKLSILAKQLNLSIEEIKSILTTKGLNKNNYEDKNVFSIVEYFFSQFFMKVSNLINYAISYYRLSKINRIFFYSSFEIKNLYDSFVNFWDLSGIEFKKYEIPTDYDAFDYTATVYNSKHYQQENENFSVFPKPIPFYKTKTGVLVFLIFISLAFILIDIYTKYRIINNQNSKILTLKKKILKNIRKQKLLKNAILKYQKEISEIKKENIAIQKQISDISEKVLLLENIQKKECVSNQFADLVNELKKYDLKLLSFEKNDNHINLIIISKFDNSSNIARFMKDLYNLGYKNVVLTEIKNKYGIYISKVSYDE